MISQRKDWCSYNGGIVSYRTFIVCDVIHRMRVSFLPKNKPKQDI